MLFLFPMYYVEMTSKGWKIGELPRGVKPDQINVFSSSRENY